MSEIDDPKSKPTAAERAQARKAEFSEREMVRKAKYAEAAAARKAESAARDVAYQVKAAELRAQRTATASELRAAWAAIPKPDVGGAIRRAINGFEGVELDGEQIRYKGQTQPLAGVVVTVDTAGELHRRATLTRTTVGALTFGKGGAIVGALLTKKVDTRKVYVLIDGSKYAWLVQVPARQEAAAREFAVAVVDAQKTI